MLSHQIPVCLRWFSPAEHGRKAPPQGSRYCATIRLDTEAFVDEEWSVLLDNLRSTGGKSEATLSFVSDKAPFRDLSSGVGFQLFEGRWPVAEGHTL